MLCDIFNGGSSSFVIYREDLMGEQRNCMPRAGRETREARGRWRTSTRQRSASLSVVDGYTRSIFERRRKRVVR